MINNKTSLWHQKPLTNLCRITDRSFKNKIKDESIGINLKELKQKYKNYCKIQEKPEKNTSNPRELLIGVVNAHKELVRFIRHDLGTNDNPALRKSLIDLYHMFCTTAWQNLYDETEKRQEWIEIDTSELNNPYP